MTEHINLHETLLDSKTLFEGKIVTVLLDTVELPNGKSATREVVRHPGAVCILAITPEDQVILVNQYRHPCAKEILEIPAGKLDVQGEQPEQCALRELSEETPYTARGLELIQGFYTAPGFCDEYMYLYRAHGLHQNSTAQADEDEFVQTVLLSKEEAKQAVLEQRIIDAKTLIALQHWFLES